MLQPGEQMAKETQRRQEATSAHSSPGLHSEGSEQKGKAEKQIKSTSASVGTKTPNKTGRGKVEKTPISTLLSLGIQKTADYGNKIKFELSR